MENGLGELPHDPHTERNEYDLWQEWKQVLIESIKAMALSTTS